MTYGEIPPNWGLGEYTTKELRDAREHAQDQLDGDLEPGDRERLTRRLKAIQEEMDTRKRYQAAIKASALMQGHRWEHPRTRSS